MPFELPEVDAAVATRQSVVFAICQIRFEETPSVSDKASGVRFHELLGDMGGPYPKVIRAEIPTGLSLSVGPSGATSEATHVSGWRMLSKDDAWLVGLFPGHVALQTHAFVDWADFADRLAQVLKAVVKVVEPAFAQRIALRIADRFDFGLGSPVDWAPYISPEFLGPILLDHLGPLVINSNQNLALDLGEGLRCNLNHGSPDASEGTCVYSIDCDLYREESQPFDAEEIKTTVLALKGHVDKLLGAATQPALFGRLST
jgi:uncharacterized protein (TIGR04255 family)